MLFRSKVVIDNPDVFGEYERVTVGRRAIADVVVELQNYRLLSDLLESDDWDIMGYVLNVNYLVRFASIILSGFWHPVESAV